MRKAKSNLDKYRHSHWQYLEYKETEDQTETANGTVEALEVHCELSRSDHKEHQVITLPQLSAAI